MRDMKIAIPALLATHDQASLQRLVSDVNKGPEGIEVGVADTSGVWVAHLSR
jgi:hypothetical protein